MSFVDKRLAASWSLAVLCLLLVRWFDVTELSGLFTVRAVIVLGLLLGVVSLAAIPMFRWLMAVSVTAAALLWVVLATLGYLPSGALALIPEIVIPSTGIAVLGLSAARAVCAALGDAIGHPYQCPCRGQSPSRDLRL